MNIWELKKITCQKSQLFIEEQMRSDSGHFQIFHEKGDEFGEVVELITPRI